jgi:PAS domain S-box-containing protein
MFEQVILDNTETIYILLSKKLNVIYYNNIAKKHFINLDKGIYYKLFLKNTNYEELNKFEDVLNTIKLPDFLFFENQYFELKIKIIESNYLLEMKIIEDNYFIDIIEQANSPFLLIDPKTFTIIYVNNFFCELTGYEKEELINNNLNIFEVDDNDNKKRKKIYEAMKNKISISTVLKNKKKNGDIFYNKVSISPIFDRNSDELKFFLCVQCDVTNKILDKLYYQAILDISKSIIIVTNGEHLKNANKRFFEITGFRDMKDFNKKHTSISELFVKKDDQYIMPYTKGIIWNKYLHNKQLNESLINKVCIIDNKGKERIFQIETAGEIPGEANEVITLTEITILLKNRTLLEEQSKHAAMGKMIAMIAHQWRQPLATLNTIYSKLYLMYKMNMLTEHEFKKSYDKSINIVEHLSETINDFRNFFHKDEIFEKVKFNKLIQKSSNILETELRIHNIRLEIQYDNQIDDLYLNINVSKVTQVLLNLLKNAFDELELKEIENKFIKINSYLDKNYIYICVSDNAQGVPNEIIAKIFEPYFSTKSKNGTGLGLYMSKVIIEEQLKGFLEVRNNLEGACFTIKLPIKFIE